MADTPEEDRDVSQDEPSPPPPPGPPQQGAQPPPPATPGDPADAKAQAKASKAYAKAMRPWWKKKRFIIPLALVLIIVIAAVAGGGGDDDDAEPVTGGDDAPPAEESGDPSDTRNLSLYPDRPDRQDDDHEAEVGDSVRLAGYTATVDSGAFTQRLNDFETEGYIVVDVTVANRDSSAQPYNTFDWRIQTPSGQVLDPCICAEDQLGSGDLVEGGEVSGRVIFEQPDASGSYFVIYKPDPINSARGIWQIDV